MSDEKQASFDAEWAWIVATYQGKRSAFRASSDISELPPSQWPAEFRASKLTLITFVPPNKFGVLAHPEDLCELIEPGLWISKTEISQVRKPSADLVANLNKAWAPPEEQPVVSDSTDVGSAASFAAAKAKRDKSLKG